MEKENNQNKKNSRVELIKERERKRMEERKRVKVVIF